MKTKTIEPLTEAFENYAKQTDSGVEFWLGRDLQHLLEYSEWQNFQLVLNKAKVACEASGHKAADHFADVNKMVELGSEGKRSVADMMLTRYACYLVAQNGDPNKQQVAFIQTYFKFQSRKAELLVQQVVESEGVSADKEELILTEEDLAEVIYEQTGGNKNFSLISSQDEIPCLDILPET